MAIGKKMGLGFGMVLLLMVILSGVVIVNLTYMHRQFSYVMENNAPVIANARHLQKLVVDMETGQRGFVITGKDDFLAPYENALDSFSGLLRMEKELVAGDVAQTATLCQIDDSVEKWRRLAAEPEIAMRRRIKDASVDAHRLQEILALGHGKRLMDDFMTLAHDTEVAFRARGDWEGCFLVELIEKCMVDRESGLRGFLITGREDFLQKYAAGEQEDLPQCFVELRRIVDERGLADQLSADIERLEELAAQWVRLSAEPEISARRTMDKHPESLRDIAALLERGLGKGIQDSLRTQFSKFIAEEERLAAVRFANASQEYVATRNTIVLLAAFAIVMGGLIAIRITRGITRPIHRLERALGMVAQGELNSEIVTTTNDELGVVSRSFNQMVKDLRQLDEARKNEAAGRIQGENELRAAETRNRTLLEGAPVCNKIIDLNSRLQYMSQAGITQLKIPDITPFYGTIYPPAMFPEPTRRLMTDHLDRAIAGETCSVECQMFDTEGSVVWYHTTFVPACDAKGQVEYVIATSVNVTDRKTAEIDLVAAKEQAEAATRAKSEFLANMSHEIRTPMTAILGFTETLVDGDLPETERREHIRTIQRNGKALLGIINDILDLSKIESGMMNAELVSSNPCRLIAGVGELIQVQADEKDLSLEIDYVGQIPNTIRTDPTMLRQILINLLGNAVKFTDSGTVRVTTRLAGTKSNPCLEIDTSDTGRGMTREQANKLFQPFVQADTSTTREFGGTGLGLSISKRFVQLLGGDIEIIDTSIGTGTTFRVTVPTGSLEGVDMLQDPKSHAVIMREPDMASPDAVPDLTGISVLLAEDNATNRALIGGLLKKVGAEVTFVGNGNSACDAALAAAANSKPFDVILMDIQMPIMGGDEATKRLREQGYTNPIIALTAHAMKDDRNRYLEVGFDDYATKPLDRVKLLSVVYEHSNRARALHSATA